MFRRLVLGDLRRSRLVSFTLCALITLATALVSTSVSLISQTISATNQLWAEAVPPSLVQMTLGDVDRDEILSWADEQPAISQTQVLETLPVNGSSLWIGGVSQAESVLEPAFVTQPKLFDFLLGTDGRPVEPRPGEVVLPVHYQVTGEANIGDELTVRIGDWQTTLTVSAVARDAQMNTSIATSKRFVISDADFAAMAEHVDTPEYLVEFLLFDESKVGEVTTAYSDAGLPAQGVAVDSTIFKLVNSLTTLLVAFAALLIAALLALTSALALRFALLAAVESDLPEIGTLKAIGSPRRDIKMIYLAKYIVLAALGALVGWVASAWLTSRLTPTLLIYLGEPSLAWWQHGLPVLAALAVSASIVGFAWLVLRRIDKMPTTDALRLGSLGNLRPTKSRFTLVGSRRTPVTVWLGLRAALRWSNWLIVSVVALSTFLMVFPAGVAHTLQSSSFVSYLGVGEADVRIDIRDGAADFSEVEKYVANDDEVDTSVSLVSNRYEVETPDGWENLVVELGNHQAFPLHYESGGAPTDPDQVALSHNEATALGVNVGSTVTLRSEEGVRELTVCGVYQDITNGGKTAKATFTPEADPLWQVVLVKLSPGVSVESFSEQLAQRFPSAKVSPMSEVTAQVLGTTSGQLGLLGTVSLWAGAGLAFLMVVLAGVLAISRERSQIATQRAIGTSTRALWGQYLTRFLTLGLMGIALGIVINATGGQALFAAGIGALGAPGAGLIVDPLLTWVGVPLLMAAVVAGATAIALRPLSTISVQDQE